MEELDLIQTTTLKMTKEHQESPLDQLLEDVKMILQSERSVVTCNDLKIILEDNLTPYKIVVQVMDEVDEQHKGTFEEILDMLLKHLARVPSQLFVTDGGVSTRVLLDDYFDLLNRDTIRTYLIDPNVITSPNLLKEKAILGLATTLTILNRGVFSRIDSLLRKHFSIWQPIIKFIDIRMSAEYGERSLEVKLLDLLCNICDVTLVVPYMLTTGLAKVCVHWFSLDNVNESERESIITLIHNLARHDDGADDLNRFHAQDVLRKWQQVNNDSSSSISIILTMAFAYLSTVDQIKNDPISTKCILDEILKRIIESTKVPGYRVDGFHISEMLSALVKLFVNDSNVDYIMNRPEIEQSTEPVTPIQFFCDLLVQFSESIENQDHLLQFTFMALCNIVWSISFRENYQEDLRQHKDVIRLISPMAKTPLSLCIRQYVPRSMMNISQAANGILINLDFDEQDATICCASAFSCPVKPLVMISYCHANSAFCDKLLELLDQKSEFFDVWIDKRFCKTSADVWELIAKAIKDAQLVIPIISPEYLASKACRQEVIYAKDRLNKSFLPVYMDKPEVTDWLDIRLAEFKYVRFLNPHKELDKNKVEEFLTTLVETILPQQNLTTTPAFYQHAESISGLGHFISPDPQIMKTKIPKSNCQQFDINRWFEEHQIEKEIRDLYQFKTVKQMITYAEFCYNGGIVEQYHSYKKRYEDKYQRKDFKEHEFALFVSALRDLVDDFR